MSKKNNIRTTIIFKRKKSEITRSLKFHFYHRHGEYSRFFTTYNNTLTGVATLTAANSGRAASTAVLSFNDRSSSSSTPFAVITHIGRCGSSSSSSAVVVSMPSERGHVCVVPVSGFITGLGIYIHCLTTYTNRNRKTSV